MYSDEARLRLSGGVSLHGKGRWIDNAFVERLESVKYEHVYLHAYESVSEPRQQSTSFFASTMTLDRAYFGKVEMKSAA
jgi:hypothetical protein